MKKELIKTLMLLGQILKIFQMNLTGNQAPILKLELKKPYPGIQKIKNF